MGQELGANPGDEEAEITPGQQGWNCRSTLATLEELKSLDAFLGRFVIGVQTQSFPELDEGVVDFALIGEGHTEVEVGQRVTGLQPDDLGKLFPGFLNFTPQGQFDSEEISRFPERGLEADGFPQALKRFIAPVLGSEDV